MRKKLLLLFSVLFVIFFVQTVSADEVKYSILSYEGELFLRSDNTADFSQQITYQFKSDYNGQYVTIGEAGRMPDGFKVENSPQVQVLKNGQEVQGDVQEIKLYDGNLVKVYNSGHSGDRVVVKIRWKLQNLLQPYSDIAQLKWIPISDWDQDLEQVHLRVTGMGNDGELYVHQRYFSPPARVMEIDNGYDIRLTGLARGQKLELFGYFPSTSLEKNLRGDISGLAQFHQTREQVLSSHQKKEQGLYQTTPLTILMIVGIGAVFYLLFWRSAQPKKSFDKQARLYEVPEDFSPLLVADHIFSNGFRKIDPTKKVSKRQISFQSVVQSTLLDLVDRGKIHLQTQENNRPLLEIVDRGGLSEAEYQFLDMAFGEKRSLRLDQLFAAYQISENIYNESSHLSQSEIRRKGNEVKRAFSSQIKLVDEAVQKEKSAKKLSSLYRLLNFWEWICISLSILLLAVGCLISVCAFIYSTIYSVRFIAVIYAVLAVTIGGTAVAFCLYSRPMREDGVLLDEGVDTYYLWHSFRNMLRDIANLDNAELESIVLWNRLLVFAILFGYTDRIAKVMRIRELKFSNDDLNLYFDRGWNYAFYSSSNTFARYGEIANKASHFSVSSSDSSGLGGGGGFAGGGGGGGGGAF